jgi:hypothetical protein
MLSDGKKRYQYKRERHRRQHRNVYKRSSFCIFKTSFTLWHRRKNTMYIVGKYKIHLHSLQKRFENITQCSLFWWFIKLINMLIRFRFLVSNATFNNISIISWRSALLVENSGVPWENYRHAVSHWQTLSYDVLWSIPRLSGIIVQINLYLPMMHDNVRILYEYILKGYCLPAA